MYCANCGKEIIDTWKVCNFCGCNLKDNKVEQKPKKKMSYSKALIVYSIVALLVVLLIVTKYIKADIKYNVPIYKNLFNGIIMIFGWVIFPNLIYCKGKYNLEKEIGNTELKIEKENSQDYMIDYTIFVSTETKKSAGSALARGIVGGTIAGPVGMLVGVVSGNNNAKTTFTVVYKDGSRSVVTVDNNSKEFELYAEHLK